MYVGVFNIHYICILCSAFIGCYEDCDKIRCVFDVTFTEIDFLKTFTSGVPRDEAACIRPLKKLFRKRI